MTEIEPSSYIIIWIENKSSIPYKITTSAAIFPNAQKKYVYVLTFQVRH